MARQSTTPVAFGRTIRKDDVVAMTSGRAGKIVPIDYIPLLRGDSASGRVGVDVELAEMPRPLLNGVTANFQAWFVPKTAHPQFAGYDEFMNSYNGETIRALGQADRSPPDFFMTTQADELTYQDDLEIIKTLGIHLQGKGDGNTRFFNTDLIDAYNLIVNFRLAAHSSKLTRRDYASENLLNSTKLAPAFWPSNRRTRIVPDYERALVIGALDLDVAAGQIPVEGIRRTGGAPGTPQTISGSFGGSSVRIGTNGTSDLFFDIGVGDVSEIFADMTGQTVGISLADLDRARESVAFGKLRASMAGNDTTGFDSDEAILAELMQGFSVPEDHWNRPWLLDSKRTTFGMLERHATDAANLNDSVTTGRASAQLSLNVPRNDIGGVIIVTVEVLPERLDERQLDDWIRYTTPEQLPNALRDVQRVEPVDQVFKRRIDARHTDGNSLYGYEPMNDVWNREFTRLGGAFYQEDPANPWTEQRQAIWQHNVVDPEYTSDHYVCPEDFPHDVFSDTTADAFEIVVRHSVRISGLTQFGDVLNENNDDYLEVTSEE